MTDYSKLPWNDLVLGDIHGKHVHASSSVRRKLDLFLDYHQMVYNHGSEWRLTSNVSGLTRFEVDELWKRTEQVDEFIRQQSRRRVTTIQLARELIDNEREICVQARYTIGAVTRYRFNRSMCRFEFYDAGCWNLCADLGDHNLFVTIIN